MGTCTTIQDSMARFVDDELPPDDRRAVADHLAGCPECARMRERMDRLGAALRSGKIPPVPDGLARDTLSAVSDGPIRPKSRGETQSRSTATECPNCKAPLGENAAKCDYCRIYQAGARAGNGTLARENRQLVLAGAAALILGSIVSWVSMEHRGAPPRDHLARSSIRESALETAPSGTPHVVTPATVPVAAPPEVKQSPAASPLRASCPDIPPIWATMNAAKAASTTEERIRILEDFLALCPHTYSFEIHNELRHYLGSSDPKASMAHSDIILRENPMHDYIVQILGNWVDPSKDPHGCVNALIDSAAVDPSLVYVQAACHYRAAEILASIAQSAPARAHLQLVLALRGEKMEPYHRRAQGLLSRLRP